MKEYTINSIIWWYSVIVRNAFIATSRRFLFFMNKTLALPMAKNLFVPMFKDNSDIGKAISFFVRFWWAGFGSLTSVFYTIPFALWSLFLCVLPFIPFIQLAIFLL